ncbi:MAG TPA: response regulator [Pyrinomonadaceae bacterium]|nr:response regulator [Pyrinomonadaceae bacterium]
MATRANDHIFGLHPATTTFRSATDLLIEPVFLIDRSHRIILANNAAQTTIGLPESALLEQPIETILSLKHPQHAKSTRIKFPNSELLSLPATVHDIKLSATFIPLANFTYFRELTPRPTALVILRAVASAQPPDQTSPSIYLQLIGQLTMRIAHDLSNSLTSIIGNAELIKEQLDELLTSPTPEVIRSLQANSLPELDDVIRKSQEMAQFITTLREYARQSPHKTNTLDLNSAINETLSIARSLLGPKIQIDFLPSDELPRVYMDRLRIEQILLSILLNCKNAMPSGGRIIIQTEHATLDAEFISTHRGARPGTYSRLSITDSSVGMDSKQTAGIFDFPSGDLFDSASLLGLPIVYSIVKRYDGYIDVESWTGKGTRYDIYIPPIAPSSSFPESRFASSPAQNPSHELPEAKSSLILVAEDDTDVQRTIERYLSRAGYRTVFTADGNDALNLYRQHKPDLLIADLGLPAIDGRALSKTIQQEFPSAQILLTSGYPIDLDSTGKTPDGFNFVHKPFEPPHRLTATIERMLSPHHNLRNDPPPRSISSKANSATKRRRKA